MWRDRLDAFWDGRGALVIGFFDEETMGAQNLRPELAISSARDARFENATLVDVIDTKRWRCGCCVFNLPRGHGHVSLRSPDGSELRLALEDEESALVGGEWRLLLTEQPDNSASASAAFRLAFLSARGDVERLARDQIARSGAKLVWAISQRRQVERREGAVVLARLWAAQRVFPAHQSRIAIEPLEMPAERCPVPLRAPFAVMEHWLRENGAPHVTLRIRVPSSLEESEALLKRTAVFLVMHQRRRLREWIQEQRRAGAAIVDPLTFEDIRRATGRSGERPEAVESTSPMIVHNLFELIAGTETEADGVSVRRRSNGPANAGLQVEIDFFGAALGDDVGLVSTGADLGDFGVVPVDPGGAPYARLFRVESAGLEPRRIDDDDLLLGEILRLAADEESGAVGAFHSAERAASIQGRRERLLSGLNGSLALSGFPDRLHAAKLWDIFEPFLLASFVALVEDAAPDARASLSEFGGYEAYRADPSLIQALVRQYEFIGPPAELAFHRGKPKPLVYRFAAACGVPDIIGPGADLAAQVRAWRLLTQTPLIQPLIATRIALAGSDDVIRKAAHITELLANEDIVERGAAYCDALDLEEEAGLLRTYLERRRSGEWTPLSEAARLAVIVEEADAYWREIDTGHAAAVSGASGPPTTITPGGLLRTVRNFFSRAGSKA